MEERVEFLSISGTSLLWASSDFFHIELIGHSVLKVGFERDTVAREDYMQWITG